VAGVGVSPVTAAVAGEMRDRKAGKGGQHGVAGGPWPGQDVSIGQQRAEQVHLGADSGQGRSVGGVGQGDDQGGVTDGGRGAAGGGAWSRSGVGGGADGRGVRRYGPVQESTRAGQI
jgi:hypothetical protein